MTPERRSEIERIYHQALERNQAERESFLAEVCGGDDELRNQIQALLAQPAEGGELHRPARDEAPTLLDEAFSTDLKPGLRIGPYRLENLLGAGGMGEVYRATDTRLNRTVAIKFLSTHVAEASARRRFQQGPRQRRRSTIPIS